MSRNLTQGRFSAQLFQSVPSGMTDLLTTEGARRRARLELERESGADNPREAARVTLYRALANAEESSALDQLRGAGREVDAEVLAHISPARSSAVNYYGSITVDYDHELAQLDEKGHRPLRTVDTDDPAAGL